MTFSLGVFVIWSGGVWCDSCELVKSGIVVQERESDPFMFYLADISAG